MNRKEFIERLVRSFILLVLAGTTGYLLSRKKISDTTACSGSFRCNSCRRLVDCSLPEARKQRRNG